MKPTPASTGPQKLLNRDFALLYQGQVVSQLGNQAFLIATLYGTMEITGSGSLLGLLMMVSSLPGLVLSPFGGTIADRHSRRAIIVGSDLVLGLAVLSLSALLFLRPDSPGVAVPAFFVVSILVGIVGALFYPAISAAIPDLVPKEKLASANSLRQFSSQSAMTVGQAVGGILYQVLGAPLLFLIDGLTYLFSSTSEWFIRVPQQLPEKSQSARQAWDTYRDSTREGFRYVWRERGLRDFLLIVAALNFFFMPVLVLLPFYADLVLQSKAEGYGFLMAGFGGGNLAGSAVAGLLNATGRARGRLILTCLTLASVLFGATGYITNLPLAVACFVAIGVLIALVNVYMITLIQMSTPGELRGRVMGLEMSLTRAVSPIGMALGGVLVDLTNKNVSGLYLVCGLLPLTVTLLAATRPRLRAFLAWEQEPSTTQTAAGDA